MTKPIVTAASFVLLILASLSIGAQNPDMPTDKTFPSAVGEVPFQHKKHVQDGAACADCHHEINAKSLKTPHPGYLESSSIKCETCHNELDKSKQKVYTCSKCHPTNPINIADESLSAKVVIHKQCWECHQVGTGKKASKRCESCHSGKKTFRTYHG